MSTVLSIDNKEIYDFYRSYNISFESSVITMYKIQKEIVTNMGIKINRDVINENIDKLFEKMLSINNKINDIENQFIKTNQDLSSIMETKLKETKTEYINDMKFILTSNNIEHINPLIRETNNMLLDKTSILINELLPKNNEMISKDINNNFKLLQSTILSETTKLLSSSLNKKNIEDFMNSIQNTLTQTNNTLTNIVSNTETRIDTKMSNNEKNLTEMSQLLKESFSSQKTIHTGITEILKKFEKGAGKGVISEQITYNILLSLYPTAYIEYVGDQKETGDIVFMRPSKTRIIIENKDHDTRNVPKPEVDKFIRDCEIQNCCGIMLAQHRGITNKHNFELQINGNNVLLYVHEVNFDVDKIKTAIEIVEEFKEKLDELNVKDTSVTIDKYILDEVNTEFKAYINQKTYLLKMLKDFNDKMTMSLSEIKMPSLEKLLYSKFAYSTNKNNANICKYCEKTIPKSMLQHHRYCIAKKEYDEKNEVFV